MKYAAIASTKLKFVISDLEKVEDARVQQIINNLKEEYQNLNILIANMDNENNDG